MNCVIDAQWLLARLSAVLRWQLTHPGEAESPDAPEVPIAGQRVWGLFLALNMARTGNGFGPNPLGNAEIEAYARMAREPIRPFEFEMLRALDGVFLETARDAAGKDSQPEAKAPPSSGDIMGAFRKAAGQSDVSTRPLTPALFDALFP
jgi:hypothetical protein